MVSMHSVYIQQIKLYSSQLECNHHYIPSVYTVFQVTWCASKLLIKIMQFADLLKFHLRQINVLFFSLHDLVIFQYLLSLTNDSYILMNDFKADILETTIHVRRWIFLHMSCPNLNSSFPQE